MCPRLNLDPWLNTLQLCSRPASLLFSQTMVQMSTQIPHYLLLFSRGAQLTASEKKKPQFFSSFCRELEIFERFSGLYSSFIPFHTGRSKSKLILLNSASQILKRKLASTWLQLDRSFLETKLSQSYLESDAPAKAVLPVLLA